MDIKDSALLVVEDDENSRHFLAKRLANEGFARVTLAENGQRALDLMHETAFDLVLLDIMMPGLNGYQVLETMKSDEQLRHIPVIVISALGDTASIAKCIVLGAVDYLTKPFDPVLLRARLTSSLEKKALQDQLQRALAVHRALLEASPVSIALQKEGKLEWANPATEQLLGYQLNELIGSGADMLFLSREEYEKYDRESRPMLASGNTCSIELQARRKNGTVVWVRRIGKALLPDDISQGVIWINEDISERKASDERIRYMALHDMLTGLANRILLNDRLNQAIIHSNRTGTKVALMFLDLDRFKEINDGLGHNIGDLLLQEVAHRLVRCVREADTVARLGGDEFVIVLPNLVEGFDSAKVARKILQTLAQPFLINGKMLMTTSSIGISIYPDDATDDEDLMKHADIAMYRSKEAGRNTYHFFAGGIAPPDK